MKEPQLSALPKGVRPPSPGDGTGQQLGEADITTPHDGEVVGMLGHTAFGDQIGSDTQVELSPAIVDAKLSDTSLSPHERHQLRIDAATEAAADGNIDRMYELLDPRRNGRFITTRTGDAIFAPGTRAIVLAAAVKSGHGELYGEMVKNARRAVGTYDDQVEAYLAAAEAGWSEGIERTKELLSGPVKMTPRGPLSKHVSNAKAHEAETRIAEITASRTTQ